MKLEYYAQYKQDEYLDSKIFNKKEGGFFLDIGAHDGVALSNTLFFEKYRNWKGICIEPIPKVFDSLNKNRSSINIQACIADFTGSGNFLQLEGRAEMLSGLVDKYEDRHLERIDREIKIHGGSREEIEVECISFNDLIRKYNIKHIDYCNIDVEGNELNILKSIDFNAVKIDVFTVENNYKDPAFRRFMKTKGYAVVKILGGDEVYVRGSKNPYWLASLDYHLALLSSKISPKI